MTSGADREVACAFAADDQVRRRRRGRRRARRRRRWSAAAGQLGDERQRQVLDRQPVDLRQRAVALARSSRRCRWSTDPASGLQDAAPGSRPWPCAASSDRRGDARQRGEPSFRASFQTRQVSRHVVHVLVGEHAAAAPCGRRADPSARPSAWRRSAGSCAGVPSACRTVIRKLSIRTSGPCTCSPPGRVTVAMTARGSSGRRFAGPAPTAAPAGRPPLPGDPARSAAPCLRGCRVADALQVAGRASGSCCTSP